MSNTESSGNMDNVSHNNQSVIEVDSYVITNSDASTLTEESINEELNRVYRLNIMIDQDDHMYDMVRKVIKESIWPYTKFTSMQLINEIEMYDEGNYLHELLDGMNLLSYNKVKRVKFWLRYGKVVLEILSACKCNAASGMKKDIVCGKFPNELYTNFKYLNF